MQLTIEKKKFTYQDYQNITEETGYELIEGELIMTPSPTPKHQRISRKIEFLIEKFVNENNLGECFYAPCDVYLDEYNVIQPDIFFISKDRVHIIGEKKIEEAPDLIIEIVSETSVYKDTVQKKKIYASYGVKEYWIVIPEEKMVEVYNLREIGQYQLMQTYYENDIVESKLFNGLKIDLKNIF